MTAPHPAPTPGSADAPDLLGNVRRYAAHHPDADAVIDLSTDTQLTWETLSQNADQLAGVLTSWGISQGDRVAIQLPNWAEFFVLSLAVLRLGGIIVPMLPALSPRDTLRVLSLSRATLLACPADFRGRHIAAEFTTALGQASERLPLRRVLVVRGPAPVSGLSVTAQRWDLNTPLAGNAHPFTECSDPDRLAQIVFTSGSTGTPKGVLHGLRELSMVTDLLVDHLGLTPRDRILAISPTAHQTGFICNLLLSWRLGIPAILLDVWDPRRAALEGIHQHRATYAQGATTFLVDLTHAYQADPTLPRPESLHLFVTIGAAASPAQLAPASETLGACILAAYGSSEICLGSVSSPSDPPALAWGSSGRAMPGVHLRIVDDHGQDVPPGTSGALLVQSPTMFRGYLGSGTGPGGDGWFRTGDLALIDTHGMLHLTGREHDLVNRGGEKIPVDAVEAALLTHPDIQEAVIVPEPDPRLGERGCLFLVATPGHTAPDLDAVRSWLDRVGVTRLHWPEDSVPLSHLPRTATGKADRIALRQLATKRSIWGAPDVG